MVNASFGIDHPLLATHDIDVLREHLISMGFNMTAVGEHPWGTSTSLAMFDGCLLEIMGVYDDALIDEVPAGDFKFGRHVYEHLLEREGVALTALHSTDSTLDAQVAETAGFKVAGHLEFGRDVTLPNGETDCTKTTLALLPDSQFPRLSFFLCQQHRPELIYVPQWLQHKNSVNGICSVNVVARPEHWDALKQRLSGLYGDHETIEGGFEYQSANGVIRIMSEAAIQSTIGPLSKSVLKEPTPCVVGMDFTVQNLEALRRCLVNAKLRFHDKDNSIVLDSPSLTANTWFRFYLTG